MLFFSLVIVAGGPRHDEVNAGVIEDDAGIDIAVVFKDLAIENKGLVRDGDIPVFLNLLLDLQNCVKVAYFYGERTSLLGFE